MVWGLTMLYTAWRPDSLPGWFFVGPFGLRILQPKKVAHKATA